MRTALSMALALLLCVVPARAVDPKQFRFTFPEEFLTLVVRKAVRDAQVKIRGQSRRLPIDDVTLTFEPGRRVIFTLRTDIESARELAKDESGTAARALNAFLARASDDYALVFRFSGRLAVVPQTNRDAAIAVDFDQSDIQLELQRGTGRIPAPAPLEKLGLWLLAKHLKRIPVAESLEITTHLNWTWENRWLSAKGHRIVARFLFDHFPFVPFTLDPEALNTEDHALSMGGRRE